jgi:hypothetical protein
VDLSLDSQIVCGLFVCVCLFEGGIHIRGVLSVSPVFFAPLQDVPEISRDEPANENYYNGAEENLETLGRGEDFQKSVKARNAPFDIHIQHTVYALFT